MPSSSSQTTNSCFLLSLIPCESEWVLLNRFCEQLAPQLPLLLPLPPMIALGFVSDVLDFDQGRKVAALGWHPEGLDSHEVQIVQVATSDQTKFLVHPIDPQEYQRLCDETASILGELFRPPGNTSAGVLGGACLQLGQVQAERDILRGPDTLQFPSRIALKSLDLTLLHLKQVESNPMKLIFWERLGHWHMIHGQRNKLG